MRARLLVLLLFAFGCSRGPSVAKHPSFPNAPVIVISVDTLRADHLPAYGYAGVDTPNIDALRRDGVLFERAFSHVPLTLPSHTAILTGQLPYENGVRNNLGYRFDAHRHLTIPAFLKRHGYATGAAVSAYVLRGSTGLAAAFDDYDDAVAIRGGQSIGEQQRPGNETAAVAQAWLENHRGAPFFYLLHLFEPHAPYAPPEPFRSRVPLPYDGEIAAVDAIVGQFVGDLKKRGIYDDAIVIFLSDHGEGLGDHGEAEHGVFLYREAIHVPLIVKLPRHERANETSREVVGLTDIFPTVARLVAEEPPAGLNGVSLFAPRGERRIYAESLYGRIHLGWSELRSLIDSRHHYIEAPRPELYDVGSDAREKKNIVASERRVAATLRQALDSVPRGEPSMGTVDAEDAKKLAALGYLSAPADGSNGPRPDPKDRIGDLAALQKASRLVGDRRLSEAEDVLRALTAANPRFTDAWVLLARVQQDRGAIAQAIETYRAIVEGHPQLAAEMALSLAPLYLTLGELDQAEAHAKLASSSDPGMAHLVLGRVAMARRDFLTAGQHARAATDAYDSRVQGLVLSAQLAARTGGAAHALELLAQADREIAERHLGGMPLLEYARGDALARLNRFREAQIALRKEVSNFPADREAWASLAAIDWLRGNESGSRATMEEFVKVNPSADAYAFAARTCRELGDERSARSFAVRMPR